MREFREPLVDGSTTTWRSSAPATRSLAPAWCLRAQRLGELAEPVALAADRGRRAPPSSASVTPLIADVTTTIW